MNKEISVNAFDAYKKTKMTIGQEYVYEFMGIKNDPKNPGQIIMPWYYLSPSDTVSYKDEFHEIAIVQRYNTDGSFALNHNISFSPETRGRISLTPGEPIDEEVFRFMEWNNKNESNKNRRETVEPIFRRINVSAIAKAANDKKKALFEAQQVFYAMKDSDILSVATIFGLPTHDIEVAKESLFIKVESHTEQFLKIAKKAPETLDSLVLIKKAIKDGLLVDNKEAKNVTFGEENKVVFEYFSRIKEQELLDFLNTNHPEVLHAITVQLT